MSLSVNGRTVHCDGTDCGQSAPVPIALRTARVAALENAGPSAAGWLFLTRNNRNCHYCPYCVRKYDWTRTASVHLRT